MTRSIRGPRMSRASAPILLLAALLLASVPSLPVPVRAAARASQGSPAPQAEGATLGGTVTDESGAVVPGVEIALTRLQPGAAAAPSGDLRATTDAVGVYTFAAVPPGTYTLTGLREGFAPVLVERLVLRAGDRRSLPIRLAIALSEGVAVVAPGPVPTNGLGAMRTDTPLIETPQAITVITRDQMEAQAVQNIQEAVRYTAGVRAETYGVDNRGDWVTLRGGSEGATVIDGLRQPLSGWWGNVRNEPYAFDRIEVVRGPASVMFGQNGPGGVMNLVSKLPQPAARQDVTLQVGNYAHKQLAADFTGPLNARGTWLYRVVLLARDSGTQVHHADDERQYVAPSIAWRPDAATQLTLYGHYQRDESDNNVGFFPWDGMLLPAPNGRIPVETFIGEPDWDSYGGQRTRLGYQFTRRLSPRWIVRHNVRYDTVDGHLDGMYANFWEGLLPDGRSVNRTWYSNRDDTRITNTDAFAEGRLRIGRTQHTLLLGVDGLWSRNTNLSLEGAATPLDVYAPTYGTFPLPPLDFTGTGTPIRTRQVGLVLQDQMKIDDRWVVVSGVRRDYAKSEAAGAPAPEYDEAAWSRRVGLVLLAPGGFAPYTSYSDSFEAITGADDQGVPFKPKRGRQVEGGVKWAPADGRVAATAAVYELVEKNRLSPDPANPLNSVQRGEVTVRGVELETTTSLRRWDLIANYTYSDAKVSASSDPADPYLGKRLMSIPEHSAALWGVHKFSLRGLLDVQAGLGVRFVGETWDGVDQLRTPSNTLVDALFSFGHGRWRYAINASNLFDEIYFATCLDRGDCWFGSRRKVIGTLTYRR